jgi:hypothetical protein
MRLQVMKAAGVGIALVALLGACGSSSKKSSAPATTPTTAAPAATTTTTSPPSPYKASATPTTGLTNGQKVTVTVSAFKAGLTLGINECAQAGTADVGAADCDLGGIQQIKVAADGTGTGTINVKSSGIGAKKHDCSAPDTRCFLSVGELSADPNAQRSDDINLTFAS